MKLNQPAPDFSATAYYKGAHIKIKLSDYLGKTVLLFFYPHDFSPVCPTELIELQENLSLFEQANCQVLAASTDSVYVHQQSTTVERKQGGTGAIDFPLIGDVSQDLCKAYGSYKNGISLRATYIIDAKGLLRYESIHDLQVARSIHELLPLVQYLQTGEVPSQNPQTAQKISIQQVTPTAAIDTKKEITHVEKQPLLQKQPEKVSQKELNPQSQPQTDSHKIVAKEKPISILSTSALPLSESLVQSDLKRSQLQRASADHLDVADPMIQSMFLRPATQNSKTKLPNEQIESLMNQSRTFQTSRNLTKANSIYKRILSHDLDQRQQLNILDQIQNNLELQREQLKAKMNKHTKLV